MDNLLDVIERNFSPADFYLQSLTLIICFAASYFLYRIIRWFLFHRIVVRSAKRDRLERVYRLYITPLLYPLLALAIIGIGFLGYTHFYKQALLISAMLKLVALFVFLRFLRISSNKSFVANIAGVFLMPIVALQILGLLTPITKYLDEYSLQLGSVRISVYAIFKAILVSLFLFWFLRIVARKSKSYIESSQSINSNTKNLINKIIDVVLYIAVFIIILKILGVDITTFTVIAGAIGVGIGFGLQKISSNFIGGIILLFEESIQIGDWIEIDNGNIFGVVKHFGGRYTLIECFDGKEVLIPNEDLIINRVTNWTLNHKRVRVEILVNVSYQADIELAKKLMVESAKKNPRCLNYPGVECYLSQFGDYDIKLLMYVWINDITLGRANFKSEVMQEILNRFRENKIQPSLPQREVKIL